MDTAININDQRTADAFWTLLKPFTTMAGYAIG